MPYFNHCIIEGVVVKIELHMSHVARGYNTCPSYAIVVCLLLYCHSFSAVETARRGVRYVSEEDEFHWRNRFTCRG
jgi:hypothetical protein